MRENNTYEDQVLDNILHIGFRVHILGAQFRIHKLSGFCFQKVQKCVIHLLWALKSIPINLSVSFQYMFCLMNILVNLQEAGRPPGDSVLRQYVLEKC